MAIKALQDPLVCSVDYPRFPKHQVGPPHAVATSCTLSGRTVPKELAYLAKVVLTTAAVGLYLMLGEAVVVH